MDIRFALYNDDTEFAPVKAHPEDACYDLFARAYVTNARPDEEAERVTLPPQERCLAKTGVFLEMEPGWEALVRPRSGNALKLGLTVLNTPGTVDAGYRNEVAVILYNAGREAVKLAKGAKVAQIAFRRIPEHELVRIPREQYDAGTSRNLKGFGSSGF